jgi:hypothetical protein
MLASTWNGVVLKIPVRNPAEQDRVWAELHPYLSYDYPAMGPLWPAPNAIGFHELIAAQAWWQGFIPEIHYALVSRYSSRLFSAVHAMPPDPFTRGVRAITTFIDLVHAESDIRFVLESDAAQCHIILPVCPWCTPDAPCMLWYYLFNEMLVWLHDPARRRPANQLVFDTYASSGHHLVVRQGRSA